MLRYLILFLLIIEILSGQPAATPVSSVSSSVLASSSAPAIAVNRTVVQTPYVKEFHVPTAGSGLTGLTIDPAGNVWFMEDNASKVGVFFPRNDSFKEYPFSAPQTQGQSANLATLSLIAISQIAYDGKTGKLWFTWTASNAIGELDPGTGKTAFYQVPTQKTGPFAILISQNSTIWFTEIFGNKIGRLDPGSGTIEEFDVPTSSAGPGMMTFDSGWRIWFTETYTRKIGVLDPTIAQAGTSKGIQEYAPPYTIFSPLGIAFSNGVVWFDDHGSNSFGEFVPQNGTWKQFWVNAPGVSIGGAPLFQSLPAQLLIDTSGNVWIAEHEGNRIARFDPSSNTLTEYLVPTRPLTETLWLALDQNGNAWFTEYDTGKIGVVNASVAVSFNISIPDSIISLKQGSSASVKISVSSSNSSAALGSFNYTFNGISTFGVENVTYAFNPSQYTLTGSTASTNLTIGASTDLETGNYTILIGASNSGVIVSKIVALVVTSSGQFTLLQLYGLPLAITAIVIVVALSVLFRISRRKKQVASA